MTFEAVISLDEPPYERLLEVSGTLHEGRSASMNYGGLPDPPEPPHFEPRDVSWSENDPVDPSERGDPTPLYEQHAEAIHEQALDKAHQRMEAARDDYYGV